MRRFSGGVEVAYVWAQQKLPGAKAQYRLLKNSNARGKVNPRGWVRSAWANRKLRELPLDPAGGTTTAAAFGALLKNFMQHLLMQLDMLFSGGK